MNAYRPFFGFTREPFSNDLSINEILKTTELHAVRTRFEYVLSLGGIAVITGEIGSGKSTAIRFAKSQLHPSQYLCLDLIATSGTITELYRQIAEAIGIAKITTSKARMTSAIRAEIRNLVTTKRLKPVLIIDESSLLRLDVFCELHTLLQYEHDSKAYLPLVLIGQEALIAKLSFRNSAALASRVIARYHLEGLNLEDMHRYILHHLHIAGISTDLFEEPATVAIHQGSGGLLRKANHLARGALIAAAKGKCQTVSAEHVRMAASEIL